MKHMKREYFIGEIREEYIRASKKFSPFHSPHEGYAIIKEEFEELWSEIKKRNPDMAKMRKEAEQLGAMALRFLIDICEMQGD